MCGAGRSNVWFSLEDMKEKNRCGRIVLVALERAVVTRTGEYYLFLTVFVTGSAVMMLELLGTRIINPYYGSTLYVWSSLITVTLVFLSVGYFLGGKIADKKPRAEILYMIIFLSGCWIILLPTISPTILVATNFLGSRFGPLCSSFILFAIPLTLLGTITPFAVKIKTCKLETLGTTAGGLYAIATIGGFVGTILVGFILIPELGVNEISYIIAFLLLCVPAIWFLVKRKNRYLLIIIVICSPLYLYLSYVIQPTNAEIIYKTESLYGQIKVVDKGALRCLLVDGSSQTFINKQTNLPAAKYPYYQTLSVFLCPQATNALLIGLGGGMIPTLFKRYDINMEIIEIDPKIEKVAKTFFGFRENEKTKVYIEDGRYFIRNVNKKYNIIILDVFSSYSVVPHLLTKEFFKETDRIIAEHGILSLYILGCLEGEDSKLTKAVYKTLREIFPYVYVFPTGLFEKDFGGIVFFAMREPLDEEDLLTNIEKMCDDSTCKNRFQKILRKRIELKLYDYDVPILTDNYNPADTLGISVYETLRRMNLEFYGSSIFLTL